VAPSSAERPEFSFRTRQIHWQSLKADPDRLLNVLIVGGGIVGAGVLRALALRDVRDCVLVERGDFASATSGASSKLIHAGIRYLETAWRALKARDLASAWRNFRFVLDASSERRVLGLMAPDLVVPKPIYLVLGEGDKRSVASVVAGVWFYYLIQILGGQFFPPPRIIFRKNAMRWAAPELDEKKVKAIFSFWDSETDDARLVIENLQSANDNGAMALNYVELVSYSTRGDQVVSEIRNVETGEILVVRSKVLINASGPFLDEVRRRERELEGHAVMLDRIAGGHVDIYPALTDESYYITASDNRLVFVLKRNEDGLVYTRVGTTERPLTSSELSDSPEPSKEEIDYLLALVDEFFPNSKVSADTIIKWDEGIRPLLAQSEEEDPFKKSREHAIIREGRTIHVAGVKLTDFRRVAVELMKNLDWEKLGIPRPAAINDEEPLRPEPTGRLYLEYEPAEVVRRTMVMHWDDFVRRRRGLAPLLMAKRRDVRLDEIFREIADEIGWDEEQSKNEKKRA
jgi:glycerol-3-phosphate dehydrogenase